MSRNVTLREVAQEAGVHVSTASRALNPETRSIVNSDTADRIREVAARLGYAPHPLARALRTQRTLTVGMTVPNLANPIFPLIYAGAGAALAEQGYSLVIGDDSFLLQGDHVRRQPDASPMPLTDRVDGWIITEARIGSVLPEAMLRDDVPVVMVNRIGNLIAAPSVVVDEHLGISLAVRHLIELGHTAIAHVGGPDDVSSGTIRARAFVECMEAEGLAVPEGLVTHADSFRTTSGEEACERLLDSGEPFTAIVAADDLLALGCYDALEARGIDVPGDVSITGWDDMPFIDRVHPPLTTVSIPFYEMGAAAGEVMLTLLTDPGDTTRRLDEVATRLKPSLAVRGSTAAPKRT